MNATIRLTVLTGPHQGRRYCLRGAKGLLVGRAFDCDVCFCGEDRDLCISRRHCQVIPDEQGLRIRDLGSVNGTYLNGHRLEVRVENAYDADESISLARDGDILTIGGTSVQVNVMDCPTPSEAADSPVWNENECVKEDCLAC